MALSKNDLIALVNNTLTSNGNEEITATDFRTIFAQTIDSALNEVDGNSRIENYSLSNNTGTISSLFNAGDTLNLCTLLAEADEQSIGDKPQFLNTSNISQSYLLDETNDKFLFPSNLYTYNTAYTQYGIRVTATIDYPALSTNFSTIVKVKLMREVDDSMVAEKQYVIHNHVATTGEQITFDFTTFVNTETDPYVVDGMYIEMENMSISNTSVTLTEFDFRLFKL